ncbi:MAG: PorV/PorQ family protein [Cryomorphaceae bacterium]|nr:PorV/PorQ family protein [Cryomorphaceae bacterium]
MIEGPVELNNMKISKYISQVVIAASMLAAIPLTSMAGNPDRAGSAGASQLLINPWARGNGLSNSNMASITGIESTFLNVAGLAYVEKTELMFSNLQYFVGSGISINSLGFGQQVGESGVIGITVTALSFGDIGITTEQLPEGGIGSFRPSQANIGISYAKEFSNSIFGGITMRIVSESISNVRAQGVSFDAGIKYVSGDNDQLKFGISLRNVGPPMRYSGDGLTVTSVLASGSSLTTNMRSEKYELPSMVNIGLSYDFLLSEESKLTANGQFTSNSFTQDQFGFGAEFNWKERVQLRAGYLYEKDVTNADLRMTALSGPSAGLSLQVPAGSNGSMIGVDYSYRVTNPFSGTHGIGVHITL